MNHDMSDAEILRQFPAIELPPHGFDPLTATEEALHRYGLPHRPDPKKHPRLSRLWHRTFSRPLKLTRPELAVDRSKPRNSLRRVESSFDLEHKWAGAQVNATDLGIDPAAEPVNTIYSQWIVPTFAPVPELAPGTTVGSWIGLGGDGNNNSNSLVQAGTEVIWNGTNFFFRAWTQWAPVQPFATWVTNFDLVEGDSVEFVLLMIRPNRALVSLHNLTSGFATSVPISPGGISNDGTSSEWIVEGSGTILVQWGEQLFTQCLAGTKTREIDLTSAVTDTILSNDGVTPLATGQIISSSAVNVVWENGGP